MRPSEPVILLEKCLPSREIELIEWIAALAGRQKTPVYLVGGFVRDLLSGRPGTDIDIAVEGDAIGLAWSLVGRYGGKLTTHKKFGTARIDSGWNLDDREDATRSVKQSSIVIDLISARSESYKRPAALPQVKRGTILDDIRRRDFTINALAIRLDGEQRGQLIDPLGGRQDLRNGLVKVLHADSFRDDPTRIYRAVRYEIRFDFKIAAETLALVPSALKYVKMLSPERIRHELDLILDEPEAPAMLARLSKLDLLAPIHPALGWDASIHERMSNGAVTTVKDSSLASKSKLNWTLWLLSLSEAQISDINFRLQFDAGLFKSLRSASRLYSEVQGEETLKPSEWLMRLEKKPLLAVYAVSLSLPDGETKQALKSYIHKWRHIKPKTTGEGLKNMGLEQGPKYQVILQRLREAWVDGEISSVEQEEKLLRKLLQ